MYKNKIILALGLIFMLIFSACTPQNTEELSKELASLKDENKILQEKISSLEEQLNEGANNEASTMTSLSLAVEVVNILKARDMNELKNYAHPQKGIRFSPYAYIDETNDIIVTANDLETYMNSSDIYTWGNFDGTGEPIDLNFSDYYDRFVYNQDFANPHIIGNNQIVQTGNTINNIEDVYPNAQFVEFHFTGFDPQYTGMDWTSLRIVMEEYNSQFYIIGIIHDEWTI
ncbi:MAG: hypothetical protein PWR23_1297 [Peptostreptococcaceae bacterium]|nr:hypothetical protein [Peptostreptococcaceae bacterium]